jgi:IS5 family transposase
MGGMKQLSFSDAEYGGKRKRIRRVVFLAEMHRAAAGRLRDRIERLKAQVRARGEHAFRVIKHQFGYVKVRYRGLTKNTAQLHTLFALANLWMVRRRLFATG